MKHYKHLCSGWRLRGISLPSLRPDRLQCRLGARVRADQEDAADGRARHQQDHRHRRPVHPVEEGVLLEPRNHGDQRLWLMYKRGLVLSFSLRSSWRYKYNDGLARHPLPHANDNQTDSKWPSHGNPPQWINEILQNLTLSTDEKETQDYVRW